MQKIILALCLLVGNSYAQTYKSEKSSVVFFSDAALEDIKAENTKGTSTINITTQEFKFTLKNINFEFEKALMKEHFNEKYMETERYRESTFVGTFSGFDPKKIGEQEVSTKGKLLIHGQTKEVEIPARMELKDGKLKALAKFKVKLNDYKIKIPKLLWQNIAEEVEVSVDFTYQSQ